MVCSGLASVATQSQVFARNLAELLDVTQLVAPAIALGFLLVLAGIVFRGIRESMWVNILCTCVEAAGLLIVIGVGLSYWGRIDYLEVPRLVQLGRRRVMAGSHARHGADLLRLYWLRRHAQRCRRM